MTQRPWNCICNSPQHQAFSKCLQMINSLEIGKMAWETMFISEMALLWETVFFFSREVPSIAGFSGTVTCLFIPHLFLCLTLNVKTLPEVWLWMTHGPGPQGLIVWLGIDLWARLSAEGIIGPVVRKLVKWSPGSSPDYNPLMSLKSLLWSSAHFHLECWPLAVLMRMN